MAHQVYDLKPFAEWLTIKGNKPATIRAYENAITGALIAYRQTPGVPDPGFVRDGANRLRDHVDAMTPALRKVVMSAWEAWRQWALGQEIEPPPIQPRQPMTEPIDPTGSFAKWLEAGGGARSTVISYAGRIRAVARHMNWGDLPPKPADVDVAALWEFIGALPGATSVMTRTAWTAFVAWAADVHGIDLPVMQRGLRAQFARPTASGSVRASRLPVPVDVAGALVAIFAECTRLTADVAVTLLWDGVVREHFVITISDPREPRAAEWRWTIRTAYPWKVLTEWAAGDAEAPDPEQPLIPAERGGSVPIDLQQLNLILMLGRRTQIQALMPPRLDLKDLAARVYAPPPQLSPSQEEAIAAQYAAFQKSARPQVTAPASAPAASPDIPPPGESVATMVGRLEAWTASHPADVRKHAVRFYRHLLVEAVSDSEEMFCRFSGNPSLAELAETAADREAWEVIRKYMASRGLAMQPLPDAQ